MVRWQHLLTENWVSFRMGAVCPDYMQKYNRGFFSLNVGLCLVWEGNQLYMNDRQCGKHPSFLYYSCAIMTCLHPVLWPWLLFTTEYFGYNGMHISLVSFHFARSCQTKSKHKVNADKNQMTHNLQLKGIRGVRHTNWKTTNFGAKVWRKAKLISC